jgi:hypothetical protein
VPEPGTDNILRWLGVRVKVCAKGTAPAASGFAEANVHADARCTLQNPRVGSAGERNREPKRDTTPGHPVIYRATCIGMIVPV